MLRGMHAGRGIPDGRQTSEVAKLFIVPTVTPTAEASDSFLRPTVRPEGAPFQSDSGQRAIPRQQNLIGSFRNKTAIKALEGTQP
jgi:hypothetical protein